MKNDIVNQVSIYKGVFSKLPQHTPTNGEPDGPLCGNGDVGVVMGGRTDSIRLYLSKNDIWCAKPHARGGGMKSIGFLEISSVALKDGQFEAVQEMINGHIRSRITKDDYELEIDTYVYYYDNIVVTRVKSLGVPIEISIGLNAAEDQEAKTYLHNAENKLELIKSYMSDDLEWETHVCVNTHVLDVEDSCICLGSDTEIIIVSTIVTNHDTLDYISEGKRKIEKIDHKQLEVFQRNHDKWWEDFWCESGVGIPSEPQIEKFWYASHYIMACCCKNPKFPPGIFGNWITTDSPNWGADYHLNYNHEAPWWGVYSSNKVQLAIPYDSPIIESISVAQKFAQEKLGCRGVYYRVGIGPKGLDTARMFHEDGRENEEAPFWGQKSNGAYAAINMLMRYYSTYDNDYAKKIVYPYLKEVALFWEDYLRFEEGRYVIYNDCIHENWAAFSQDPHAIDYSNDFNPILTLGLLKTLFKGILDISDEIDPDQEKRQKWVHILEHLSEFPTQIRNGREVFRYTERGMDWCEGNSLGIQHIFPCGAIGLDSDKKLLEVGINTLEELNRWEDYNAFPTFFTAAARLGYNPDVILENMKAEFHKHAFPNMFVYYGGGGIECCSTVPSCINEMLLQSYTGIIRVFPVWNQNKDVWFYKLRAYGAFVITGSLQQGKVQDIEIFSEKGRVCKMEIPWENRNITVYEVKQGKRHQVMIERNENIIHFKTTQDTTYIISNN